MSESADCSCETILSPQMEYIPGVHHEVGCTMRREPATFEQAQEDSIHWNGPPPPPAAFRRES